MIQFEPTTLLRKLNRHCTKALEGAAGACVSRGHYEVTVEHFLAQLIRDPNADVQLLLHNYGVEAGRLDGALQRQLEKERSGNPGRPVFSPLLLGWIRDAWMLASTDWGWTGLRSGALLAALVLSPHSYTSATYVELFENVPKEDLRRQLPSVVQNSIETEQQAAASGGAGGGEAAAGPAGPHGRGPDTALGRFTIDFTAQARSGKVDPVIGRENEIRQMVDILARRRKNNPIIVGEAGVGKTALVEGLAQRIALGEVPGQLLGTDLLGLDMGLLQAGAGVKGEFENRLKGVIEEVKASQKPIILFIDEAHTIIGAGGAAGGSDAANLLKPALARGELRTVAATTWSEYKKYFEKDPALTRRFQLVKVEEPSEEIGIAMMRGLAPHYEKSHGIRIRDEAVMAAVTLSNRYISARQLPDKAVDLLDTCAARVSIARDAKPPTLLDLERSIQLLEQEQKTLQKEALEGYPADPKRLEEIDAKLADCHKRHDELEAAWLAEKEAVTRVLDLRQRILAAEEASKGGDGAPEAAAEKAAPAAAPAAPAAPPEDLGKLKAELDGAQKKLDELQGRDPLIPIDVTGSLVAQVVSDWTGIPLGKMVEDEATILLELEKRIGERIKGQGYALKNIAEVIRSAKLGLGNPKAPIGVFLCVGPSGVGKTETGLSLSELLFGGERFMVTVNMSEFQEKHTVSRLIGSPPGYVGYGEGGVLTEAVRQRPYSIVMLDEVEKADPEVLNLFYQVFDKGMLSDGEGREIDFKNTVLLMTSNLASDIMTQMCMTQPGIKRQAVIDAIRPVLSKHFKPALLARMNIVPFFPLSEASMREIVELKLGQLKDRILGTHKLRLEVSPKVVDQITKRCTEVETGARNIDHIMSRTLLPLLSKAFLTLMSQGPLPESMLLDVAEDGEYILSAGDGPIDVPPSTEPSAPTPAPSSSEGGAVSEAH
jgi:type VI secretion system protein VasG